MSEMKNVETMSVEEFGELCASSFELQKEIESIEKGPLKDLKTKLKSIDALIMDKLENMDVSNFSCKAGTVVRNRRFTVPTPKTREDKEAFFDWLKAKGDDVYFSYLSINSQSLNALYRTEQDLAAEEGNLDFKLPGIGEPGMLEYVSRRGKK